ncbi:MAG: hypothetical protein D6778_01205 [Nitrospirae bacterium]|nr:MAG: hypothetical protein D6778_01205 [Nitrospirota bacterium]
MVFFGYLKHLLKRRGFQLYRHGSEEALFIPSSEDKKEEFYQLMGHYAFRLLLRDVLKQKGPFSLKDVTRYATEEVSKEYMDFLVRAALVKKTPEGYIRQKEDINTFGDTLEWYVAEVLKRELALDCLWSVSFKGTKTGGDYDVLSAMDGDLLYIEVKSSPPRQIYDRDVMAFLKRVKELCPEIAIFLVDTHLRMKDKIVVLFREALLEMGRDAQITRLQNETFLVNPLIYITNSRPSISLNLQFIISHYYRRFCDG